MLGKQSVWFCLVYRIQGKNHKIKVDTKSLERVEEIESRQKSRNACYQSVQIFLSSSLLYNYKKGKRYRIIIFLGCENLSLTLKEKPKL